MLDNKKSDARIVVLKEGDEGPPKNWYDYNININSSLYLNVFNANGGRLNPARIDDILVTGEVLPTFMRQVSGIMPNTRHPNTKLLHIGVDPVLYREMTSFCDKFPKYDDGAAFSFQICMFTLEWVKIVFKLPTIEDARLFILHIENSKAGNLSEVLVALEPLGRRLNK